MSEAEAQAELLKIGLEVQKIDHWLDTLAGQLPRPENQDDMFECLIPCDLASGIYGGIEFLREEALRQVIEGLLDLAKLTDEKLEHRFSKLQDKSGGGSPGGSR